MPRAREQADGAAPFWEGKGHEEAAVMARVPESPRLRRLLKDLEALMMTEGFLHLSTDDIARRLRCSKATLYRLAPSREELFELVVERWLARVRDTGWQELAEEKTWPAKLVGFLTQPIRLRTREASHKFVHDMRDFPGGYRIWLAHQHQRMATLEAIIDHGAKAGAFQEVHARLAADLMLTSVRRAIEPDFLVSVGLSLTEAFEEWYRILEFGLIRNASVVAQAEPRTIDLQETAPRDSNGKVSSKR
jgi:AcrR family transcriptional regulator